MTNTASHKKENLSGADDDGFLLQQLQQVGICLLDNSLAVAGTKIRKSVSKY